VSSREQEERLQTAITPEEAQSILNNVQTVSQICHSRFWPSAHVTSQWLDARSEKPYHIPLLWRSAIYVLYSLVNEHKIWPTSMVIKGCVFDDTSEPLSTGGSATVYVGKWQGKDVAVKKVHMSKDVKKVRPIQIWDSWCPLTVGTVICSRGRDMETASQPVHRPVLWHMSGSTELGGLHHGV
jgi:hypothetical protein